MTKIEQLREWGAKFKYSVLPLDSDQISAILDLIEMQHEAMLAVLCDPEGVPCFDGSDGDRAVIEEALAAFEEWNKP